MVATYRGPSGREYQLTAADMIWAGRAVAGEAGENANREETASVLWALMNRFMLYDRWPTYGRLARKFCQPINPKWGRDGVFCRPGGKYHGTKYCSERLLKRREYFTNMPADKIPVMIQQWVRQFAAGQLLMPVAWTATPRGRINNWGATWLTKKRKGRDVPIQELYPWGVAIGGNWFFEDPRTPAGIVTVEDSDGPLPTWPTGFAMLPALSGLLVGGALGGLGYLAYRYYMGL